MNCEVVSIQGYKTLQILGQGGQANVFLCQKNQILYAIKLYTPEHQSLASFRNEQKILFSVNHKNIVEICEAMESGCVKYNDNTQKGCPMIVMPYAERGQLSEYISVCKGFSPPLCKRIFKQILSGIEYLHQIGVVHRDIKPENILINDNFDLKITDFGLSCFSQSDSLLKTIVGTEGFQAPQIVQGEYDGKKIDIFSLGVILFVLFTGYIPFTSTKKCNQIYKYIIKKNYQRFWSYNQRIKPKDFFPEQLKILINCMLSSDPKDRPQFQSLKNNQWLNSQVATIFQLRAEIKLRYQLIQEKRGIRKQENKKKSEI